MAVELKEIKIVKVYATTHREFLQSDKDFMKACEDHHVPITTRQASKWRRHAGRAYKLSHGIDLLQ